jgi:hypothetical protein
MGVIFRPSMASAEQQQKLLELYAAEHRLNKEHAQNMQQAFGALKSAVHSVCEILDNVGEEYARKSRVFLTRAFDQYLHVQRAKGWVAQMHSEGHFSFTYINASTGHSTLVVIDLDTRPEAVTVGGTLQADGWAKDPEYSHLDIFETMAPIPEELCVGVPDGAAAVHKLIKETFLASRGCFE